MKKKKKFDKTAFMFIAPAFILFTLFIIVPTVSSVYYSLTSWDGISPDIKFIGLANYKEIFTSDRFGNAMKNTTATDRYLEPTKIRNKTTNDAIGTDFCSVTTGSSKT